MQTTSQTWKDLWAAGNAWLETQVTIDGTTYTEFSNPVINRALMQSGLSIGNAVSATCSFTVRTSATIPRSGEVTVEQCLTDGTTTSEWLPAGTFYISHRSRDAVTGLVTLECYDAMLKANAEFDASGSWPRAMSTVVDEIAATLGVTVDARTVIETGDAYMVSLPEQGTTINAVLCGIAAVHGGNWIITVEGKLRLVPLLSASDLARAVEVDGVIGAIKAEATQSVTGLRVITDDGETIVGNETGLVVDVDSPYINENNIAALQTNLIGQTYQGYTLTQAVYDPAAEVGDYVQAGASNEVASVIYGEVATLGPAFRGDLTALAVAEIADEYPYIGVSESLGKQIRRLSVVMADELDATNARLDNLSVSDIKAGIIHSADYQTVVIAKIYPASTLYPATDLYPNYGEQVLCGFAIDFQTGQIYGAFYSEQIAQLQAAVQALQDALVYPKSVPSRMVAMVTPIDNDNNEQEEER